MHRSTPFYILVTFLLSSFYPLVSAAPAWDTVFDVAKGSVPGSCDAHLPLLGQMFDEILKINANTIEQLKTDNYNDNQETRKLLKAMFAILPTDAGKEPTGPLDLAKLNKVRGMPFVSSTELLAVF